MIKIAHNAEIWWALKCVYSHYSYRSNIDNSLLFRAMDPVYKPFEYYQMSKDKVAYYILYGIVPVFKNLLLQSLANSPFYAILFDESMNDHL